MDYDRLPHLADAPLHGAGGGGGGVAGVQADAGDAGQGEGALRVRLTGSLARPTEYIVTGVILLTQNNWQ